MRCLQSDFSSWLTKQSHIQKLDLLDLEIINKSWYSVLRKWFWFCKYFQLFLPELKFCGPIQSSVRCCTTRQYVWHPPKWSVWFPVRLVCRPNAAGCWGFRPQALGFVANRLWDSPPLWAAGRAPTGTQQHGASSCLPVSGGFPAGWKRKKRRRCMLVILPSLYKSKM